MKLQSLMEKADEKTVKCPECGAFGNEDIQEKYEQKMKLIIKIKKLSY